MQNIYANIKKDIGLYLFIAVILEVSNDSFWFGTSGDKSLVNLPTFLILSLLSLALLPRKYKNSNLVPWIVVLILCSMISSIISEGTITGGPVLLSCLFIDAYLITTKISFQNYSRVFVNIILLGTLYSVVMWLLATLHIINLEYYETTGGAAILGYGQCFFFSSGVFLRNTFVFREPGLFQIMINMAFLFEILTKKEKIDIKHIAIYFVGILTSFSTAGYITFGTLMFVYFRRGKLGFYNTFLFFAIVIGIYLVLTHNAITEMVFSKISGNEENTRSTSAIISVYILTHDIKYLLFGTGVSHLSEIYRMYGSQLFGQQVTADGMLTNTFLNSAATFGIWIFLYFIIGFYSLAKSLTESKRRGDMYPVFFVFLLLFSNEAMYYSLFPHLLVFYGLNKKSFGAVVKTFNNNMKIYSNMDYYGKNHYRASLPTGNSCNK